MFKGSLKATAATAALMLGLSVPVLAHAETPVGGLPLGNVPPGASPVITTTTKTTVAPTSALPTGGPIPTGASMPQGATSTTTTDTTVMPVPGGGPSPLTAQPNTPKIVQEAMNGLNKTDPINMDDMIRAQDAINRLDLLLEIEKRQTELKKLRDDRNKPAITVGSIGSSIPASALNLPPMKVSSSPLQMPGMNLPKPTDSKPSGDNYSLKRIVGTEGHYSAVIATGSSTVLSVRPGETLPDGSKVKTVGLTSLVLVKDKKSKTLTIPSDSYIVRGSDELVN